MRLFEGRRRPILLQMAYSARPVSRADIGSRTVSEAGINRLSPSGRALLRDRKPAEPGLSGRVFMKGKTVVVTGGTSGIGEVAAEKLAEMGARIVLIARSKSRGKVTLARLHEKAPDLA